MRPENNQTDLTNKTAQTHQAPPVRVEEQVNNFEIDPSMPNENSIDTLHIGNQQVPNIIDDLLGKQKGKDSVLSNVQIQLQTIKSENRVEDL